MTDSKPVAIVKPALIAGGSIRAVVPQDFESAYRLAQVVVAAGMAPKSLDSPEKACVAILHGLEVGMTPMAALQSIAVINGMPTIYGDGMLGLIRQSGLLEEIIEDVEVDDKGEPTIAVCKVKRRGESQWAISSFTRVEAQRAGLWNKQGPWQGYRPRMMKMRARSWALRDKFADVLRGLHMAEEAIDMGSVSIAPPPPEPRRSDVDDIPPEPSAEADGADGGPATTGSPPAATPPQQNQSSPELSMPLEHWSVGDDVLGQEAIIKRLDKLIGMAETRADLDAIESENAERLAKITGNRRANLNVAIRAKRESLT